MTETRRTKDEELLDRCRQASTRDEQSTAWKELTEYVTVVQENENETTSTTRIQESVARSVLLEWPYGQVTSSVDQVLDACGLFVAVSTCISILKELAASSSSSLTTNLPLPSILQACWATLQRMLLQQEGQKYLYKEFTDNKKMEIIQFVKVVLLLPQIISNACHAVKVRLPLSATSTKLYPRLVECAALSNKNDPYLQTLIQTMLTSRKGEYVAMGLCHHHPYPKLKQLHLSPRQMASLLLAMLQFHISITVKNTKVLDTCSELLQSSSLEHREAFVQKMVFTANDRRLCPIVVQLLEDCEDGALYSHLCDVAETWSQWSFCHETDTHQQQYVTQVLICGLLHLQPTADATATHSDDLTLVILQGVTHRLESSLPQIRQDGMRVAQQVAKRLGQDLQFDELEEEEQEQEDAETRTAEQEATTTTLEEVPNHNAQKAPLGKKKNPKAKIRQLDPDADYDSDDDDEQECESDDGGSNEESTYDDDSTVFDDELVPYDLEDQEDDLVETPKPLHLLEAFELLRTEENHDHAYSRQETAVQSLPDLIRKRPDDLPDVAVSLAQALLRMENKFDIEDFRELKHESILALTVEEPSSVGQHLIEAVFQDGGLSDRLNCFAALQEAAYELSGSKQLEGRQATRAKRPLESSDATNQKAMLGEEQVQQASDQVNRIQSKTRQKRSPRMSPMVITNRFTAIAPAWFYSLLSNFVKHKQNETLWTGSTGSQLLANFFRTLAAIVEFSGIHSSHVLAADLLQLVWSFRDADVAEVRLSVLVSVATSIAMLPEEKILSVLLEEGGGLPQIMGDISEKDPDNKCRSLALSISRSIVDALESVNNPLF